MIRASVFSKMFGAFGESDGMNFAPSPTTGPVTYGWQGLQYDEESGLYFNGPRMYDPNLGIFLSIDPVGLAGGDTNFYRSRLNNPTRYVDPFGLAACNYDVRNHTMICVSSTGQTFKSSDFVAGTGGPAQNDPSFSGVPFVGPIPPGTYAIGPQRANSTRRNLTPIDQNSSTDGSDRGSFQSHGCSNTINCSQGCVASPSSIGSFNSFINNDPSPSTLIVN